MAEPEVPVWPFSDLFARAYRNTPAALKSPALTIERAF
jgi:hypothetical protein